MQAENMIDEMSDACYNMDNQTTLRGTHEKQTAAFSNYEQNH